MQRERQRTHWWGGGQWTCSINSGRTILWGKNESNCERVIGRWSRKSLQFIDSYQQNMETRDDHLVNFYWLLLSKGSLERQWISENTARERWNRSKYVNDECWRWWRLWIKIYQINTWVKEKTSNEIRSCSKNWQRQVRCHCTCSF